jgi:hypothetical protein
MRGTYFRSVRNSREMSTSPFWLKMKNAFVGQRLLEPSRRFLRGLTEIILPDRIEVKR